jgi:hypothetical protein
MPHGIAEGAGEAEPEHRKPMSSSRVVSSASDVRCEQRHEPPGGVVGVEPAADARSIDEREGLAERTRDLVGRQDLADRGRHRLLGRQRLVLGGRGHRDDGGRERDPEQQRGEAARIWSHVSGSNLKQGRRRPGRSDAGGQSYGARGWRGPRSQGGTA